MIRLKITRFENNRMKANPKISHLLVSKKKTTALTSSNFEIGINGIKTVITLEEQRLLTVIIDDQLNLSYMQYVGKSQSKAYSTYRIGILHGQKEKENNPDSLYQFVIQLLPSGVDDA